MLVDSLTLLQATIAALTQYPSLLHEAYLGGKPFSQMKLINKVKFSFILDKAAITTETIVTAQTIYRLVK